MRLHLRTAVVCSLIALATAGAQKPRLTLTSSDLRAGQKIPAKFVYHGLDCTGENISPAVHWTGAPSGTKSYALTVYDPDAPTGSGWWHWVVYNIPASTTTLPTGAGDPKKNLLPSGAVEGNTDIGAPGYMGPCPPKGDKPHHYIFTVYALNTEKLDVPAGATAAYVGFNIHGHQLAKATMTALYGR